MSWFCEMILGLGSCTDSLRWAVTPDQSNTCVPAGFLCPRPWGWKETSMRGTEGLSPAFCPWDFPLAHLSFCSSACHTSGCRGVGHTPTASRRDGAALARCYRGAAGWAGLVPGATSPMEMFVYGNGKGRWETGAEGKGKLSHITPTAAGLPADRPGDAPSRHFPMTVGGTQFPHLPSVLS